MTKRATIDDMARWLMASDDIVILGHVYPDGDATGSCLGLCHALREMGKRAVVCLPGGVPGLYADLPGAQDALCPEAALPFAPSTALAVDVSDAGRLGEAGEAIFEGCERRAVIDHHGTNPGFGQLMLLDAQAAAAGEIAVAVIEAMGSALSPSAATCLFTAISTDTGHFSYSSTRVRTFQAAQSCVAAGIDVAGITERLYRTRTRARTRLMGLVLSGLNVSEDGRMAWAFLTQAMLDEACATREDNEGIVNYLREIAGVDFAVLVEQRGDETKLSMRSSAAVDVAACVAVPLGGGGHPRAAGATVKCGMEEALERALALARKALA